MDKNIPPNPEEVAELLDSEFSEKLSDFVSSLLEGYVNYYNSEVKNYKFRHPLDAKILFQHQLLKSVSKMCLASFIGDFEPNDKLTKDEFNKKIDHYCDTTGRYFTAQIRMLADGSKKIGWDEIKKMF